MNKKILLILPLIALSLSGCNGNKQTPSYDDEDEIVIPPGTIPAEPTTSETGGTGGGNGITSTTDNGITVTGIESVTGPESFDIDEGFDLTSINLKLTLSNNGFLYRHPESLDYDVSPAQIGQLIDITAIYGDYNAVFQSRVTSEPHDIIDVTMAGTDSSAYKDWTENSSVGTAKYNGYTGGETLMTLSTDADKGIVSTHSGGRIKKMKIAFDEEEPTTASSPSLLFFMQTTPFKDKNDLAMFDKKAATMQIAWQSSEFVYIPDEGIDYFYFGVRSYGATAKLKSISIYWDSSVDAPTLSTMAFTSDSTAFAETDYTQWDLTNVKVNGTFSNEVVVDITRFVTLATSTPVPSEAYVNYPVSITATYSRDTSKVMTDDVRGIVDLAMITYASWTYKDTVSGGALTFNLKENSDSTGHHFYSDDKNNEIDNYIQIKNSTAYWSTCPGDVKLIATLGGSNRNITLEAGYGIYAVYLDADGNEIAASKSVVASSFTTADNLGKEFTITMPATDNVYGIKLTHKQVTSTSFNARYFSFALRSF